MRSVVCNRYRRLLIEHGDHSEMISRNLLITHKARVVFMDFHEARVLSIDAHALRYFKQDMLEIHRIVFERMVPTFDSPHCSAC